jgi:hypothetical protein
VLILKKLLHTIQIVVFGTHNKWKKIHLDMKFAFHHGNVEEVFMTQPKGFVVHGKVTNLSIV